MRHCPNHHNHCRRNHDDSTREHDINKHINHGPDVNYVTPDEFNDEHHAQSHIDDHGAVYHDQQPNDDESEYVLVRRTDLDNLAQSVDDFGHQYGPNHPARRIIDNHRGADDIDPEYAAVLGRGDIRPTDNLDTLRANYIDAWCLYSHSHGFDRDIADTHERASAALRAALTAGDR